MLKYPFNQGRAAIQHSTNSSKFTLSQGSKQKPKQEIPQKAKNKENAEHPGAVVIKFEGKHFHSPVAFVRMGDTGVDTGRIAEQGKRSTSTRYCL